MYIFTIINIIIINRIFQIHIKFYKPIHLLKYIESKAFKNNNEIPLYTIRASDIYFTK